MAVPSGTLAASARYGRAVLTADDFTYLGMVRLPNGNDYAWSHGALTGRVVGDEIRLFMVGRALSVSPGADNVTEFVYPGSQHTTLASAPVCTVSQPPWGDIYDGKKEAHGTSGAEAHGILWHNDKLWWVFHNSYNTAGFHDVSVGFSTLNDGDGSHAGYGPWRTTFKSHKTGGFLTKIPSSSAIYSAGYRLAAGCGPSSGVASSPFGCNLSPIEEMETTDAADDVDNEAAISCTSVATLDYDTTNPMPRLGFGGDPLENVKHDYWNDQPANTTVTAQVEIGATTIPVAEVSGFIGCARAQVNTSPAQMPYYTGVSAASGPGNLTGVTGVTAVIPNATTLTVYKYDCGLGTNLVNSLDAWGVEETGAIICDFVTASEWINGSSKHGLVQFGGLVKRVVNPATSDYYYDPVHNWYGASSTCCHGQTDPFQLATGPGCGSRAPILWIWDPADIDAAFEAGGAHPATMGSGVAVDMAQTFGWDRVKKIEFGGAWFESTSKLLFVTGVARDTLYSVYQPRPVIYVFAVDC